MGRTVYRVGLGLWLGLGIALVVLSCLDLATLVPRYFSYGGGLAYNLDTIVRFKRYALWLGGLLVLSAGVLRLFQKPLARFARDFEIEDSAWAAHPMLALFVISVAGLFLEVVVIRWVSVEIRIFAYFKNLALLACFFGFGFGAMLYRRRISYLLMVIPVVLLVTLVQFDPWLGPLSLRRVSVLIAPQRDLLYWGAFTTNALLHVLGFGLVLLTFLLVVASFVPIGQLIARMLAAREPLKAYSVNIAGSLAGLWLYAVVSFLWLPPPWWFGVPLLLTVFLVRRHRRAWLTALGMTVFLTGVLAMPSQPGQVFWSPYQKLVLSTRTGSEGGQYYHVDVNNTFYQTMEDVRGHPAPYRFPYQFVERPARVLLVGAGAGNDAAEAVLQGAGHVDAVDIDPVILKLGQRLHPQRPYDSARVARILDDARAYFKKATGPYDVIVYARLDSHTLLSGFTNVRLDHYVYTRESFEEAKRLLAPDGVLVLSFVSTEPWLEERLANTLKLVFGQEPLRVRPFTLVVGSQEKIHAALTRDADLAARSSFTPQQLTGEVRVPTDDWPYLYLKEPRIPSLHLLLSALVVVLVLGLLRGTGTALFQGGINWHFFFLGAAFLLLEFQGVSRFALLFGTTWFVNTLVISAFLCMILAANWYVTHRPIASLTPYYAGLLGSVLLVLMPQQILLGAPAAIRGMLAGAIQAAPVFFAGIIFATSFRATPSVPAALGSNLLGAVFGGLLESLSYVMGITGLGWIVMALYGLSWISLLLGQRLALPDTAGVPAPTEAAYR